MNHHAYERGGLPAELARAAEITLSPDLYSRARTRGLSLSGLLEELDPSGPGAALDAFERQLALAGIRVAGPQADAIDRFFASAENAVLFPEYVSRAVRAGMSDFSKLDKITATRTKIDDDTYRTLYMDDSVYAEGELSLARVSEGAAMPRIEIKTAEHSITLSKYGRYIETTYEAIRRKKAPVVEVFLRSIGMQIQKDKFREALSVLISGDGNDNAAPVDPVETDETLTYPDLIQFSLAFAPYELSVLVADATTAALILNLDEFKHPEVARGLQTRGEMITPLGATLIVDDSAPANKIVGLDRRFALEEVYETGVLIESDRLIRQQIEGTAISEVAGFGKLVTSACRVLNLDIS
ncbi:phage major capsid protein [bacterium]|nr:phage major capsid protein [bacterium]